MNLHDLATRIALGTANRPAQELPADLVTAPGGDPADQLLDAAAAVATLQAVDLPAGPTQVVDVPVSTWEPAPAALAGLGRRLLAGRSVENDVVLAEFLPLVAERRLLLPPHLLIDLLDTKRAGGHLADEVAAVLDGPTAAIAALNPDWRPHTDTSLPADHWSEGTRHERVAYLRQVRSLDPAAGRELLLQLDWKKEPAPVRTDFVKALEVGLSQDDESFLEGCLDGRAATVREEAARLLSMLPGSALVGRAEELAATHMRIVRSADGEPVRIEASEPELTKPLERDGYARIYQHPVLGQVVERVPSSSWPDLLGVSAAQLVDLPVEMSDDLRDTYRGSSADADATLDLTKALGVGAARSNETELAELLVVREPELLGDLSPLLSDQARAQAVAGLIDVKDPCTVTSIKGVLGPQTTRALAELLDKSTDVFSRECFTNVAETLARQGDREQAAATAVLLRSLGERFGPEWPHMESAMARHAQASDLRAAIHTQLSPHPVRATPDEGNR